MDRVNFFGIRHLSPNGSLQLKKFLDEVKPDFVLIEGPSDANSLIPHLLNPETKPPIAILAYTNQIPIKTVLYPFATYSPEYQALLWSKDNSVNAEFIDLPTFVTLAIKDDYTEEDNDIMSKWVSLTNEEDFETYWERDFEHNINSLTYKDAAIEFGKSIREFTTKEDYLNIVREAFMKRKINEVLDKGYQNIVVVTGAYHTEAIKSDKTLALNDIEFKALPRCDTLITLMPYSYYRLSTKSGYGAGNKAPYYYQLLFEAISKNDLEYLSYNYLSSVSMKLREDGFIRSSAEVIEAARLAKSLAFLHDGRYPTLKDLRDAAICNLGYGDVVNIAKALTYVEIGTSIGSLPFGISRTSIQDDFYNELKRLNLERFKTNVANNLDLDLRENRHVKSVESAYLDLNRSLFLHRLSVLNISFAKKLNTKQDSATWAEHWVLQWKEEAEIELVEAVLLGETIELACSYKLKETLDECKNIDEAAKIIRLASFCGLIQTMEYARSVLQGLATENGSFVSFARTALELSLVINYNDIRKYNADHFIPLLSQIFLKATLLLLDAANCNNQFADSIIEGIDYLNRVSLEHSKDVNEELWLKQLKELSNRDDKNPKISGYACSILLERGEISMDFLSKEISRRLSPGIDADLGTGWFEGLASKNRYVLLSKLDLWEQIDNYVSSLDNEQFKRALVFLRRAFSSFLITERHHISENLEQIWNLNNAQEEIDYELTMEEKEELDELSDYDFGDL